MAQAEFLKKRADEFLDNARENAKRERFNLAAFNYEQACQLYLKYYLFRKLADFTRTHQLRELLSEIGKTYDQETLIEQFIKEENRTLADLEEAYLTSRYLPAEFNQEQTQEMERLTAKLLALLIHL